MSSSKRAFATSGLGALAGGVTIAIVVVAGGCSADVTRFSFLGGTSTTGTIPTPPGAIKTAYVPQETPPPPISLTKDHIVPSKDYKVVGRVYDPPPISPPPSYVAPAPKVATEKAPGPLARLDPPPAASPITKEPPSTTLPSGWSATYTMQSGDSLYAVAARHKVSLEELKRVNGITDATRVRAGTKLAVPGRAEPAAHPAPTLPPRVVQIKPRIIRATPEEEPKAEAPPKMAKRGDITTDALPAPALANLRWPVRGKVIAGFGPQPNGSKHEGINLAAPLGTDVHAAEAGKVHYASDGLKSYGNLILIRHDGDWTTAYAHVDRILVKPNQVVKRGQVIAKVGKSGPVSQPQLRFELRKNSVPVDPLPHLAN